MKAGPKRPKATTELKQKVESRKQKCGPRPPEARYMRGARQVQAMCLGGDWEVQARYMRGTCMVHAWYKPPQSHPGAKGAGGERPCSRFAPVRISVALQRLVPVPAGRRSTVSHFLPAKSRTRWKASLPTEVAPGGGAVEPWQRRHRAAVPD